MKTLTTLVLTTFLALTVGCSLTGQARANDDYFTQAELDSMLAPVALYPDSVLSHVLIAATYPLEVIQAARWSREHPGLRGEDAVSAVEYQNWDPSVKALVAFPDLLERMDEDLQWTQRLGDAFLLQEEEVVASIQYLRSEAYSQGHLASNDRVKVVREKEYIYIEPARSRVVYVPYYDPRVVYSSWRWSSHPPVYWHRPSGFSLNVGFHWGRPYHVRPNFYFSSFHWAQRRVVVVNHHHHYYRDHGFHSGREVARFREARHWRHDPVHRRGVSYRGRVEKTRFVGNSRPASASVSSRSSSRAVSRSDRRDWAAERRSSAQFDRKVQASSRTSSRSDRFAELRGSSRSDSRAASRAASSGGRNERLSERRSDRASISSDRGRTLTGRAPARAESRSSRAGDASRSSSSRSARVSESLRSSSSSRGSVTTRASGSERASSRSSGRSASRPESGRSTRSSSQRASVSVPRDLSIRSSSSSSRDRQSAPSRSSEIRSSSRGASIGRSSAPSRQSAPVRSRSSGRDSAPSRSTPRVQSAAPSRSSKSSTPSRSSRASSRSSRGSSSGRSRGGDSRRGGDRREERR